MLLFAQLLYDKPPEVSARQIRERLAAAMPQAKLVSNDEKEPVLLVVHEDHLIEYEDDKKLPAQTAILTGSPIDPAVLSAAVAQTWGWADATEAVERARHQIVVTELMASGLEPRTRVALFFGVLKLVSECLPPVAIHCQHAERIVDPAAVLNASPESDADAFLAAVLNVRLFRVENAESEQTLMDTRGLAALGLPDLQIHFRDLDPGQVAGHLYGMAVYIYTNGDCIEDGQTVQGLTEDDAWKCQHEPSLAAPSRVVIDNDPGDPFAAGTRRR